MRYVVAVADAGSFQLAAQRLRMSQPPLSRQIRDLERRLGVPLFNRRPTRLTEAGRVFVESARQVLIDADRVVERTCSVGLGLVRVGYTVTTAFEEMPALFAAMRRAHPKIRVEAREAWDHELTAALADGDLDAVLGRLVTAPRNAETTTLRRDTLCVAVGPSHRLADRPDITLADLDGERMQFFPRHLAPRYHDEILAAVRAAGLRIDVWENPLPGLRASATNLGGGGFMLLPTPVAAHLPGIRRLPVRDGLPRLSLELIWRTPTTPAGAALVETARRLTDRT